MSWKLLLNAFCGCAHDSEMVRNLRRFTLIVCVFVLSASGPCVTANPVGDFFKRVGQSFTKFRNTPTPTPTPRKQATSRHEQDLATREHNAPPTPTPTPTPIEIRPASSVPPERLRPRDLPYAVAVPNHPGLVTSPYAPNQGYVDVHAFPKSTEVVDPYTGKVFLTP